MKTIKQTYTIAAPITEVWKAFIEPKYINGWGGGPAKMDEKIGTEFTLWGGDIHGKNIEVQKEKKLVQEWYGGDWPQPSRVTFTLTKLSYTQTRVDLLHEDIPDENAGDITDGWKQYYLGAMKKYLEK